MSRKKFKICGRPEDYEKYFKPAGVFFEMLQENELSAEELEVIKLCDFENYNQTEAASLLRVSRTTIQRLLKSARFKITDSILNSKAVKINGKN
ncbi:MAG: DUF134 domain-containing protein [Spirochaetes bacterium]|nr:DUF134 domain-containing protein [Spirochaetota bacterium]